MAAGSIENSIIRCVLPSAEGSAYTQKQLLLVCLPLLRTRSGFHLTGPGFSDCLVGKYRVIAARRAPWCIRIEPEAGCGGGDGDATSWRPEASRTLSSGALSSGLTHHQPLQQYQIAYSREYLSKKIKHCRLHHGCHYDAPPVEACNATSWQPEASRTPTSGASSLPLKGGHTRRSSFCLYAFHSCERGQGFI